MSVAQLKSGIIIMLALSLLCFSLAHAAPPVKVTVTAANPNSALQGEALDVVINGSGFDHGSTVKYLVGGTKDDTQINVLAVTYNEADDTLTTTIQVESAAIISDYDIEVRSSGGRRGKGTTLFSVFSSGNGGGTDLSGYPLNCSFSEMPGDSFLNDGLGDYQSGVDNVACTTGDSHEGKDPSNVRFYAFVGGNLRKAVRMVDFVIDESTCSDPAGCAYAPDQLFEPAASIDDMEHGRFFAYAYDDALGGATPHIQNLPPDATYDVMMGFNVQGMSQRWIFNMSGRLPPDESRPGLYCFQEDPLTAIGDDVTLYVWPDDDLDGRPDGFTFTTADAADLDTSTLPPTVITAGTRTAIMCSNEGPDGSDCGGPGSSDTCHLISHVEVQFTWHAITQ